MTAAEFRLLLSPADIADIEGRHYAAGTLRAYALSFAEGIRSGRVVPIRDNTAITPSARP